MSSPCSPAEYPIPPCTMTDGDLAEYFKPKPRRRLSVGKRYAAPEEMKLGGKTMRVSAPSIPYYDKLERRMRRREGLIVSSRFQLAILNAQRERAEQRGAVKNRYQLMRLIEAEREFARNQNANAADVPPTPGEGSPAVPPA